MFFSSWLRRRNANSHPNRPAARRPRFRPMVEGLEDRTVLSAVGFSAPVFPGQASLGTQAVAVGDFNGDHRPDLACALGNSSQVEVLLSNGDGTFQAPRAFAAGASPFSVAVGDFDGDGKLDLAVADSFRFNSEVSVLLGNGDGTFQTRRAFAAGEIPTSVVVGDFNRDGRPDLAVANYGSSNLSVLLGNGDGTFQAAQNIVAPISSLNPLTTGDFDGDHNLDLVVSGLGSLAVLRGNGDGSFQSARTVVTGAATVEMSGAADFNGDGKQDIVVLNRPLAPDFRSTVSVLLGNGDGTFQSPQTVQDVAVGSAPHSLSVADFDGDGRLDLAVVYNPTLPPPTPTVRVSLGNGDGTFQAAQVFDVDSLPSCMAAADFNGDGRPDLVVGHPVIGDRGIEVLLNAIPTTTTQGGPASSTYGQPITYTVRVTSGGAPVTAGTVTLKAGYAPISPALPLDADGQVSFSLVTLPPGTYTITASYSGTPGGAGTTGLGTSAAATGLTVGVARLSAAAVNFAPTAGAPYTGPIATFANPAPFEDGSAYSAVITWGDGTVSAGTVSGTTTLTVSGPHTYADAGIYAVTVEINHKQGYVLPAIVYPTAGVTALGQDVQHGLTGGVGFWNNRNGQALIQNFNGGPDSTALANWLATSFGNLYGWLAGASHSTVAGYFQSLFAHPGANLEAKVLATALNVYATTLSLGGTLARAYGFTVTDTGLGADAFNVGADGSAFGVADDTTRNVYELLRAVDRQAVGGVLYGGDRALCNEANDLLDALLRSGSIR